MMFDLKTFSLLRSLIMSVYRSENVQLEKIQLEKLDVDAILFHVLVTATRHAYASSGTVRPVAPISGWRSGLRSSLCPTLCNNGRVSAVQFDDLGLKIIVKFSTSVRLSEDHFL
jgi:hypothetical protein